jgi:hypothetical protein
LRDPVLAPFVAVASIPAMILATALATVALAAGRVAAVIFLAVMIAVGGWLTGQWIVADIEQGAAYPAYSPVHGGRWPDWLPTPRRGRRLACRCRGILRDRQSS